LQRSKSILWCDFSLHPYTDSASHFVVWVEGNSPADRGREADKNARDSAHDELDLLQLLPQFLLDPHDTRSFCWNCLWLGLAWLRQRVSRQCLRWKHLIWSDCHLVRFGSDPILDESINPFQ